MTYYSDNKLSILEKKKNRIEKDWRRHLFNSKRWEAKRKGHEFSLNYESLSWPEFCPALGIKLDYNRKVGINAGQDSTPTFDRIDNSKGYTTENTVIVSKRANRMKSDASIEELNKLSSFYSSLSRSLDVE